MRIKLICAIIAGLAVSGYARDNFLTGYTARTIALADTAAQKPEPVIVKPGQLDYDCELFATGLQRFEYALTELATRSAALRKLIVGNTDLHSLNFCYNLVTDAARLVNKRYEQSAVSYSQRPDNFETVCQGRVYGDGSGVCGHFAYDTDTYDAVSWKYNLEGQSVTKVIVARYNSIIARSLPGIRLSGRNWQ